MPADSLASHPSRTCDTDIENMLQLLDTYIFSLVKKQLGRNMFSRKVSGLDIDDVAQSARIKLWLALKRGRIHNIKAYVGCIVRTECIDMMRRNKYTSLFFEIDEAEPHQEMQNPFEEVESKEIAITYMVGVLDDILSLPPRQQYAVICALKEQVSDTFPLAEIFIERGLDIQNVAWPVEKKHLQTLKSSLSIARKRLRASASIDKKFLV